MQPTAVGIKPAESKKRNERSAQTMPKKKNSQTKRIQNLALSVGGLDIEDKLGIELY